MRLGRYVLAEVLILIGGLASVGFASQRAASYVAARWIDADERRLLEAQAFPPRGELSEPPELAIAEEPAGVFLGMSDDLLLERARTQPIAGVKMNRGGSSLSFRVDFADGSRASYKPAQTNLQTIPRKEVAAYRLNRLLGLNAVPPAAPRLVSREELFARLHPETIPLIPRIEAETVFNPLGKTAGVVMYWVPEIKNSGLDTPEMKEQSLRWLGQGMPIPLEKRQLAAQLSELIAFDFLTSNPDRYSGGNMKMTPDGSRLFFMDNTMAFFLDGAGNHKTRPLIDRTQRYSRRLYHALDRISVPTLKRLLSDDTGTGYEILTGSEIRALVARRDALKRHIQALAATHGERNVLVFP